MVTPESSQSSLVNSPTKDNSALNNVLFNGNGNGSASSTAASRRGTISKGYKGRGRAWGEGEGEEDDLVEGAAGMDGLRVDTEMENGGWASSRRSESLMSDGGGGGDGYGGERLRILIERP